jgi:hypothetical protein
MPKQSFDLQVDKAVKHCMESANVHERQRVSLRLSRTFFAGKSTELRSYTVYIYSPGQPCPKCMGACRTAQSLHASGVAIISMDQGNGDVAVK